jgi:transitional endoplasmic reticulum ATPase
MLGTIYRFTLFYPLVLFNVLGNGYLAVAVIGARLQHGPAEFNPVILFKGRHVNAFDNFGTSAILAAVFAGLIVAHVVRIGFLWLAVKTQERNGFEIYEGEFDFAVAASLGSRIGMVALLIWYGFWGVNQNFLNQLFPLTYFAAALYTYLDVERHWMYGVGKFRNQRRAKIIGNAGQDTQTDSEPVARVEKPSITFKDIYGNTEIKARLLQAGQAIVGRKKDGASPRNGILLSGEPGNGKTVFAEALAGELKLPLLKLTHSDVASQWVGERTSRIKRAFDQAISRQPCALFIDEIDSFIPDRSSGHSSVKEDTDVVNSLLTLLVDIRKHKVLVIAATNHMDRLDGAAVREGRFDFKVEISPPDMDARLGLLTKGVADNLKGYSADDATIKNVAARWNGFSVKRILAVTEELPSYLQERIGSRQVTFEDFMAALRRVQGRRGATPESAIPMDQLILSGDSRESLDMLANRLRDPLRVERLGGSLPTGVLFYGPPGTGKTSVCKSLAKEVGWAFLPTSGAELARDPKGLQKLYDKAKELRPAIIFIDEADDLLRNREYSNSTESTNKLLTIMDGAGDRVRDVLFVAATNNPEQIDSALLRGGRFTEKVGFELPTQDQMAQHIANWIVKRNLSLASDVTSDRIAGVLGAQSIANVEAVLQHAVNRAISRATSDVVVLSYADVKAGVATVLGSA